MNHLCQLAAWLALRHSTFPQYFCTSSLRLSGQYNSRQCRHLRFRTLFPFLLSTFIRA